MTPAPRRPRRSLPDQGGLVVAIVGLVLALSWLSPYFLSPVNFANIGVAVSVTAIMAFVATITLISGGLDLSLGAVVALSGVALGQALAAGAPGPAAIAFALAVGLGCGLINSAMIVGVGINPFIVTIGSAFILRGFANLWSSGYGIVVDDNWLRFIGTGQLLGIKVAILVMSAVLLVVYVVMRFTRLGAHIYAIGGSETAALRAGVGVSRVRVMVYCASALSAAIAGIVLAGITGVGLSVAGQGIELTVIAAVILGGTSLLGGSGSVAGTLLGVVLLGILNNGLTLLGIANYWQIILQGSVLLLAVLVDEMRRRRRARA